MKNLISETSLIQMFEVTFEQGIQHLTHLETCSRNMVKSLEKSRAAFEWFLDSQLGFGCLKEGFDFLFNNNQIIQRICIALHNVNEKVLKFHRRKKFQGQNEGFSQSFVLDGHEETQRDFMSIFDNSSPTFQMLKRFFPEVVDKLIEFIQAVTQRWTAFELQNEKSNRRESLFNENPLYQIRSLYNYYEFNENIECVIESLSGICNQQ